MLKRMIAEKIDRNCIRAKIANQLVYEVRRLVRILRRYRRDDVDIEIGIDRLQRPQPIHRLSYAREGMLASDAIVRLLWTVEREEQDQIAVAQALQHAQCSVERALHVPAVGRE